MHARVAMAEGEREEAERDAHDALAGATSSRAYLPLPNIIEFADLAIGTDNHRTARLFGAAQASRQRMGAARSKVHQAGYNASVAALRDASGDKFQ
jgi:hypothetical protein